MSHDPQSTDTDKATSRVTIGNVYGGIRDSIIAGGDVIQHITQIVTGESDERWRRRNRRAIIEVVRDDWVRGVLEKSLRGAASLELRKEYKPNAVEYPLATVLPEIDESSASLPRNKAIADIFDDTGGSLLILGAPGSGKTITLLELARDTLARAQEDPECPIPVVFDLSRWTPPLTLADWLVEELNTRYRISTRIGRLWMDNDELLLLLDGLDEVKAEHRNQCIAAINEFRRDHGIAQIAVCSRTEDYEVLTNRLALKGAIELQPLTQQQIDSYLSGAGVDVLAVRKTLEKDESLQELARSPLTLSVMVLAYQDASMEELQSLDSVEERRKHIFDLYVHRMFQHKRTDTDSLEQEEIYPEGQTIYWLHWLASRMKEHSSSTTFLLEQLQPSWLAHSRWRLAYFLATRLSGGLLIGLAWLILGSHLLSPFAEGDWRSFSIIALGLSAAGGIAVGFLDWTLSREDGQQRTGETLESSSLVETAINILRIVLVASSPSVLFVLLTYASWYDDVRTDVLADALVSSFVLVSLFIGIPAGIVYGRRRQQTMRDIRTLEDISWSWRDFAVRSSAVGVILGIIIIPYTLYSYGPYDPYYLSVWDQDVKVVKRFKPPNSHAPGDGAKHVMFDATGTRLWYSTNAEYSRLIGIDVRDGTVIKTLRTDAWNVGPNRTRLLSSFEEPNGQGKQILLDMYTGNELTTLPAGSARFSPDGRYFVSQEFVPDGTGSTSASAFTPNQKGSSLKLWKGEAGKHVRTLVENQNLYAFQFSLDGTQVAALVDDGHRAHWRLWKTQDGSPIDWSDRNVFWWDKIHATPSFPLITLSMLPHFPNSAIWTPWNTSDGGDTHVSREHVSPDYTRLIAAYCRAAEDYDDRYRHPLKTQDLDTDAEDREDRFDYCKLELWNVRNRTVIRTLNEALPPFYYSADSQRILTSSIDGTVRLWHAKNGESLGRLEGTMLKESFNSSGTRVVTAGENGRILIWDAEGGSQIDTVDQHKMPVSAVAFKPQSDLMVSVAIPMADYRVLWAIPLLIGLVFGGFTAQGSVRDPEDKTDPNQGMWLTARNTIWLSVIIGVIIALCLPFSFYHFNDYFTVTGVKIDYSDLSLLLHVFLVTGLLAALWYGALDVIQHLVLRLILVVNGYTPWNYAHFLDYASERVLLHKIGGGYEFTHQLLLEYFADLEIDVNYT